jgi:hypothetical protein
MAVSIASNTPPVFAVVFAALIGIGARLGIISSADLGAYISRRCSAVSFGASGVGNGSVFTLTFCAASIARVLFGLGITGHLFNKYTLYFLGRFTIRAK